MYIQIIYIYNIYVNIYYIHTHIITYIYIDKHKINIKIVDAFEVSQVPSKCKNHTYPLKVNHDEAATTQLQATLQILFYHFPPKSEYPQIKPWF